MYKPERTRKLKNFFAPGINWLKHLFTYRILIKEFFFRELKGKFAGSIGGLFWVVFTPISQILVYLFVFNTVFRIKLNALQVGTSSFVLFFLSGIFPWLCFQEGISRCSTVLLENANLITKVQFPVEVLPTSALVTSFFINSIGLGLFFIYMGVTGALKPSILFFPIAYGLFFLFSVGLGHFLASITVFIRDVQHFVQIILFIWFYLTPIIYPLDMVPKDLLFIMKINPVLPFLELMRASIFGMDFRTGDIILALAWTGISFIGGLFIFQRLKGAFGDAL